MAGNFLAADRERSDDDKPRDLCPLLSGYIEGVLSKLLRSMSASVTVKHPHELCMHFEDDRSSCEFKFEVATPATE